MCVSSKILMTIIIRDTTPNQSRELNSWSQHHFSNTHLNSKIIVAQTSLSFRAIITLGKM
jgi:hypothetical protein